MAIQSKQKLRVYNRSEASNRRRTKITGIGASKTTRYRNKNHRKNKKVYNRQG